MVSKDVKTAYLKNIPIAHGEISVVLANDAEQLMKHSCELAESIKQTGIGVLIINCGMSDSRFRNHAETATTALNDEPFKKMPYSINSTDKKQALIHSSVCGDLVGEIDMIGSLIFQTCTGVVILAGWEWTSSSYRRKERLLYAIRKLMKEMDVAFIIYSQTVTTPDIGKYDRGGLGKLAMLAISIIRIDAASVLETAAPKPPPFVVTPEEWKKAEESAQLLKNKINDLQDIKPPIQSKSFRRKTKSDEGRERQKK
jgi:hypothetical protein